MANFRDETGALADALDHGLIEVAEVIAWAETWLLRVEMPSAELCDLCLARDHRPVDVASMLRRYPGTSDPIVVQQLLMVLLHGRFRANRLTAEQVAGVLWDLAQAGEIEDAVLHNIVRDLQADLDLFGCGYCPAESLEKNLRCMVDVLE